MACNMEMNPLQYSISYNGQQEDYIPMSHNQSYGAIFFCLQICRILGKLDVKQKWRRFMYFCPFDNLVRTTYNFLAIKEHSSR